MLLALALFSLPLGQTFTVDDDGPADFAEIQAAIDFAAPGDVIVVSPGYYLGFTLAKDVSIVGTYLDGYSDLPTVNPVVGKFAGGHMGSQLDGVTDVSLTGLHFLSTLTMKGGTSGVRVDACGGTGVELVDSDDILISRSIFNKQEITWVSGLQLVNSSAQVVECTLRGIHGDCWFDQDGGSAITSFGNSSVSVIESILLGGSYWDDCPFGYGSAKDGPQVTAMGGHLQLAVRGTNKSKLKSVTKAAGATISLTHSGIDTSSWGYHTPWLPKPAAQVPAEPFLLLGPSLPTDGPRRAALYGPLGASSLLLAGQPTAAFSMLGILGEPLQLDPASVFAIFPFVLLGGELPVTLLSQVPSGPGVVGVTFELQALVAEPAGIFATNSVPLVLGL
ncbi:MAG: hypothetical protein P1V81_18650 [Planctomycetota bacterium]|nr:hypothetical protein [Planctomycetota bacterium]